MDIKNAKNGTKTTKICTEEGISSKLYRNLKVKS
jgi:hypothetical protein